MITATLTLALALSCPTADAPKEEPLWSGDAPGATGKTDKDRPTITVYLPPADKAVGTAVVVCPGGGYGGLAIGHEGEAVADWLTRRGVAAFVLKYRLAPYRHPIPLTDAQRAVRTVRARAREWNVDPAKVGIWGFSAGGHLASTVITHFDDGKSDSTDPVERVSCRPDFAVLAYPVISLAGPPVTHMGSRKNLLGDNPDQKLIDDLSNEKQVTAKTPPTFLFHTSEDAAVPPENSILFYTALRNAKVPAELHIYEKGRHGVGLANGGKAPDDPVLATWTERLADWMAGRGLLKKAEK
jgi:acetyl esterase/lipase